MKKQTSTNSKSCNKQSFSTKLFNVVLFFVIYVLVVVLLNALPPILLAALNIPPELIGVVVLALALLIFFLVKRIITYWQSKKK